MRLSRLLLVAVVDDDWSGQVVQSSSASSTWANMGGSRYTTLHCTALTHSRTHSPARSWAVASVSISSSPRVSSLPRSTRAYKTIASSYSPMSYVECDVWTWGCVGTKRGELGVKKKGQRVCYHPDITSCGRIIYRHLINLITLLQLSTPYYNSHHLTNIITLLQLSKPYKPHLVHSTHWQHCSWFEGYQNGTPLPSTRTPSEHVPRAPWPLVIGLGGRVHWPDCSPRQGCRGRCLRSQRGHLG